MSFCLENETGGIPKARASVTKDAQQAGWEQRGREVGTNRVWQQSLRASYLVSERLQPNLHNSSKRILMGSLSCFNNIMPFVKRWASFSGKDLLGTQLTSGILS